MTTEICAKWFSFDAMLMGVLSHGQFLSAVQTTVFCCPGQLLKGGMVRAHYC
jgi:hypothetical protein